MGGAGWLEGSWGGWVVGDVWLESPWVGGWWGGWWGGWFEGSQDGWVCGGVGGGVGGCRVHVVVGGILDFWICIMSVWSPTL